MSYAERIKEVRKDNGISQEQLAEIVGVSRQCVTKWEARKCYPSVDNLLIMARDMNTSIDWIFSDEIGKVRGENGEGKAYEANKLQTVAEKIINRDVSTYFSPVSTGFKELDQSSKGILRHEMYVISGAPCIGKTALALSIANNVSKRGRVLWFSFKETKEELWQKLLNMESRVEYKGLTEKCNDFDKDKILKAAEILHERNLEIIADFDFSIEHVMEKTIGCEQDLDLIVIDSLDQLITKWQSDIKEAEKIIAESLNRIKRNCDCPLIVIDGLDSTVKNIDYANLQNRPLKHEALLNNTHYHKWVLYRKNYYYRHSERSDGRANAEVFLSEVNWGVRESETETARLIFDYKTYTFDDSDMDNGGRMGYKVIMKFDDGETVEISDGAFQTKQEAEDAATEWAENYRAGGEFLIEAGESCCEAEIAGWEIVKE